MLSGEPGGAVPPTEGNWAAARPESTASPAGSVTVTGAAAGRVTDWDATAVPGPAKSRV